MPQTERQRQWYLDHKVLTAARALKWSRENRERRAAIARRSREKRREKIKAYSAKRYAARPYVRRATKASNLARHYQLAIDTYEAMLVAQDGKCAICQQIETAKRRNGLLSVDHNHETNEVRKLLCDGCNKGLGCFRDNPELLRAAAAYIDGHTRPPPLC